MPPVELLLDALLYLFLPAALTAAMVLALLAWIGGPKSAPAGSALGLAAGTFLGLAAREAVQHGKDGDLWGSWWRSAWNLTSADSTWNGLPWAALALLALGWASSWSRWSRDFVWVVRASCVAAIAAWLVPPALRAELWWLGPGFTAVVLFNWALLEHVAQQPRGGTALLCLSVTAFVVGGVLLYAASGRASEAAIIMGAALAGLALIAWWRGLDASAAIAGAVLFLSGLLLAAQLEKSEDIEITWHAFALPAIAPLFLAVSIPLRNGPVIRLQLLRLAFVVLPLAVAIILARLQAGPLQFE